MNPSLESLREFALQRLECPLFVTVSGAHLYGFTSPDSDVDLRGAFVADTKAVLGLARLEETAQIEGDLDSVEIELVAHELGKYLRLLTKANGYVLEQILSPLVVLTGPAHRELCELARAGVSRRLSHHYRGFATGIWRDFLKAGDAGTVKQLLYAYRVLMTGIVVLEQQTLEANVWALAPMFDLDIAPLVEAKTQEKVAWDGPLEDHEQRIKALFERLDRAAESSSLPEVPPNRAEISEFLVKVRLDRLASPSIVYN